MLAFLKRTLWATACLAVAATACGLTLPAPLTKTPAPANAAADPLGRDTPSGTVFGFLQAAQSNDWTTAAQYLQLSPAKRASQGEDLSGKLKVVMDRAFRGNLRRISNQAVGSPDEEVSLDHQRIGTLAAGDLEEDLILVRSTDPSGARVWLISSETLGKVPELYDQVRVHQVETHLPSILVTYQLLGLAIWQWVAILLALPVAAGLGWLAAQVLTLPSRLYLRMRGRPLTFGWPFALSMPLGLVAATAIHGGFVFYLHLPLLQRHYYQQIEGVVAIVGFNWLLWRVVRQIILRARERALYLGRTGAGTLMILGERILKAVILVAAIFAILGTLGFNLTTPLAGLGIGGIAVAFAAQKTLENLFGGLSVLGDEVIRVGDSCKFGDAEGTVEDISLRSTRIRTDRRTQLSIPNGALATMNVENLSRRDKILFNPKLGLRYEASPDQLRYVLAQIRRLLYEHPKIETNGARARFVEFAGGALTIEIFSYVLTRDYNEFLAIREDLLLRIMEIIAASGTALALSSQTLYLGRDAALDKQKAAAAVDEVRAWRESGKLPFPDFTPSEIAAFRDSLTYPQPGSSLAERKDKNSPEGA
jgi:MscS family membrane protein